MPRPGLPRLQLLAAAALFSTGGAAIKLTDLSAWWIACLRSGIAGLVLFLLVPAARRLDARALLVGAAYAATVLLYVAGNRLTTAASTTFLQATAPLWLLVLAPLVLHERVRPADLVALVLIGAGLALLWLGPSEAQRTAPDPGLGNLVGAAAGLCWALTLLGLRWIGRGAGEMGAIFAGNALAFAAGLILALAGGTPFAPDGKDLLAVGWLGVFQIALAYALLGRGLRGVPAFEASLFLLLEPVLSPLWAWLVLGERVGPAVLAGGALVLGATLLRAAWSAPAPDALP